MKRKLSLLLITLILITSIPLSPNVYAEGPEIDLIISEYVEASGYTKAIELYNGTNSDIDLSGYSIGKDVNGNGTFSPVKLSGTIAKDSVFVITCKHSSNTLSASADLDLGGFAFNGDDQVALYKGDIQIDKIGIPGDKEFGKDRTFVRNKNILVGNTTTFDPNDGSEWTKFSNNTFVNLGDHISDLNLGVKPVTSNAANGSELTKDTIVELSTLTSGASIKVAFKTGEVYGEYVDYAPITVSEAISFKAMAVKDGVTSTETEFTYTVLSNIQVVEIKDAKAAYVDEVPEKPDYLDDNGKILVEGIVTAIIGDYIYIQDQNAGLGVLVTGVTPKVGDKVSIYGQLATKYNFMYLNVASAADFKIIDSNQAINPVEITAADLGEAYEGQLVKLNNITTGAGNKYGEFAIVGAAENAILKPSNKLWLSENIVYESYTGVVYYGYNKYQVLTRDAYDVVIDSSVVRSIAADVDSGMVSKDTAVTLNTLSQQAEIYYTLDGSEPSSSSTLYQNPIVISKDVVLKAVAVQDGLSNSEILTRNYVVNESIGVKTISQVQGQGHISPYASKTVENVQGIVTSLIKYKFGDKTIQGFYMQSNGDADDSTSDAILVYSNGVYAIGDDVSVTGTVVEQVKEDDFYAYDQDNQLSVTTLQNTTITVNSNNNPLPATTVLGNGGRQVPHDKVSSDNFSSYDVTLYAIDFYESLEGMLVTMNNPVVVGAQVNRVVTVVADNAAVAKADGDFNSEGGIVLSENDANTEKLPISGAIKASAISHLKTVKMGELLDGPIKGVLDYEWGSYMIYLTEDAPSVKESKLNDDTYKFDLNDEELRIGSFNVYNHGGKDKAEKTTGIAKQIVNGMKSPDIIGLVEVQDNDSADNTDVTDASKTYQMFIDEIVKQGGPLYKWTDIEPIEDKEGGEPGGNIRVGFLYNPARVTLKEGIKGGTTEAVSVDNDGHLTLNPGRIEPMSSAFDNSRKSLAAEFIFNGEEVIVIANHFKSKGGDNAIYGNVQAPIRHSEGKRVEQAQVINTFIDSIVAKNDNSNIVVLGDLNDYQFSNSIKTLEGSDKVVYDMINTLPLAEQFTYMFGGNAQVLDHILVTDNLRNNTKIDIININSILSKTDTTRFSDHDPVVVAISSIGKEDTVNPVTSSTAGQVLLDSDITLMSPGATIYYSLGEIDTDDMSNNIEYTGPITIDKDMAIQAIAVKGDLISQIETFTFTVVLPQVNVSVEGIIEKNTEVVLSCDIPDVTFYYSTDTFNTVDITKNKKYNKKIKINKTGTLTVIAEKNGVISPISTYDYKVVDLVSVKEARGMAIGEDVILDVVITSTPGSFGYKAFTFQDKTGGGYVFTKSLDDKFVEGSHVRIIGTTNEFNSLFQINMTSITMLNDGKMPKIEEINISDIGEDYESELVSIKNLRVGEITTNSKKNSYISLVSDNQVIKVKLDSRSGDNYDAVMAKIKLDDVIDITGVVLQYKDNYTFTLRSLEDIIVKTNNGSLEELTLRTLTYQEVDKFAENDFIKISVKANLKAGKSGLIIFKVEKDGKPYRFGFVDTSQNQGHYSIGFDSVGMMKGVYTVTTYCWDNIVEMKPLASPISKTFEIE